ncbi:MAG: 1-deoxy-D-xylulose-5-phosphate reductoisomerase [Phycisphaerales bacterium]
MSQTSARGRRAADGSAERRVIILGSTGSIGTQTLEVIAHLNDLHERGRYPHRFRVVGLATGKNAAGLAEQSRHFGVTNLALATTEETGALPATSASGEPLAVHRGGNAALRLVEEVEADIVLAAMVGAAGLPATLAALERGCDVALANKETLVAAGELVVPEARRRGAALLPVDSEHAGVWQCLSDDAAVKIESGVGSRACPPLHCAAGVVRVTLTASGGPFRTRTRAEVYNATPADALNHPTWRMGPKVTVDSASLTNKALEIIEAHWLFGLAGEKIDALVHPQSIVHALVEFADGSVTAQLASPDMRLPIQAALTHPLRPDGVSRKLDLGTLSKLEFSRPDLERFPSLGLAYEVIRRGGTSGAVFNAANEAAVELFLAGEIPFGRVPELSSAAMHEVGVSRIRSLDDVLEADAEARRCVASLAGTSRAGAVS